VSHTLSVEYNGEKVSGIALLGYTIYAHEEEIEMRENG